MRANSPSSVFLSLTLHVVVGAIIFVTTMFVTQQDKLPPVIFELVAGPPTAPDELVAPALGNTTAKVALPPDKSEPKVQETVETPPAPESVAPPKPKADTSIVKELKKAEKMSYKDYLKKHPTPKPPATPPAQRSASVQHIDAQGIANGVRGGSTANTRGGGGGKALTREEQSELNTYISFLLNALKEAHDPPPGVSDQLETKVTFDISANGNISSPRIARSSGNREFDESVLEAFRKVRSIGPTPDGKPDTWTVTFRMKEPE
jgi:TonB family protein